MKKIGLICATLLAGLSLSACNNMASQSHKASSSSSSAKVVKHHHKKTHKQVKKHNTKQSSPSNASSSSTSQTATGSNDQQVQQTQRSNNSSQPQQAQQGSQQAQQSSGNGEDRVGLVIALKDYGDHAGEAAYEYHTNGGNPQQAESDAMNKADQALDNGQSGPINY